jgi:hypothetical protein
MLADPGGMEAKPIGLDRFIDDIGNKLIRWAWIVAIAVVAEREIAELHGRVILVCESPGRRIVETRRADNAGEPDAFC